MIINMIIGCSFARFHEVFYEKKNQNHQINFSYRLTRGFVLLVGISNSNKCAIKNMFIGS